jgi:hypothetical protein
MAPWPDPAPEDMTELQIRAERFCLGLLPLVQDLHRKFGGDLVHSPLTKDPVEQREIALQYIDDSRPYLAEVLASHFGSKLHCSAMGLEYNHVHITGG